jgi:carboxymethylenebutenolidase
VRPAKAAGKLPGVLVVHENRGLNPYIEDVARRFGTENFIAFAPDGLTSVGGYPGDDEKGGALFAKVDKPKMTEDFIAAARWLKARPHCSGKIGAVGFCFGGGIANTLV